MLKPIRLTNEVDAAVQDHRETTGETFNAYVVDAILRKLPGHVRKRLPKPGKRGRPKKRDS